MATLKRCHSRGIIVPRKQKAASRKSKKQPTSPPIVDPAQADPVDSLVMLPPSEMAAGLDETIPPGYWENLRKMLAERPPFPEEELYITDPEPLFLEDRQPVSVDSHTETSHTLEEAKSERKKDKFKKGK